MLRRGLLILTIPCLLLSQTATVVAHIHCHDALGKLGKLPHFHWPEWLSGHTSGHRHIGRSNIVVRLATDWAESNGAATLPASITTYPEEHDASAVYIERIPIIAQKRSSFVHGEDGSSGLLLLPSHIGKALHVRSFHAVVHPSHGATIPGAPLYLHHKRLLK